MIRRPPRSTRTDTLFPYTTLFRSAMRLAGFDAELLDRAQVAKMVPGLDMSRTTRFPVEGGLLQPRGGTARHDAVAWGYAYGADRQGVDLIENCEVTGFLREHGAIVGVETTRGPTIGRASLRDRGGQDE